MNGQRMTQVRESRLEKRVNFRVFAGRATVTGPWSVGDDGLAHRLLSFAPGERFGFDRWEANTHGSTRWRVLVCQALVDGVLGECVPDVRPTVKVLADVSGSTRAQAFMGWLLARDDDLNSVDEDGWMRVHLYFTRMPLARLCGVQLAVGNAGS